MGNLCNLHCSHLPHFQQREVPLNVNTTIRPPQQQPEICSVWPRYAPVSIDVPTLHRGLVEGRQAVRRMLQPYSRHVEAVFEPVIVPQLSSEQHRRLAVATAQLYAAGEVGLVAGAK